MVYMYTPDHILYHTKQAGDHQACPDMRFLGKILSQTRGDVFYITNVKHIKDELHSEN